MTGAGRGLAAAAALGALAALPASPGASSAEARRLQVPPVRREFRAAWVATVANIDWPSRPGLPVATQKAELAAIVERAGRLHLNAIVLQVRPACDAIYRSTIEPWSEYLTGRMGQAPRPDYDPLAHAIALAHRRGIEIHAWFNPYRAHHPSADGPIAPDHVSREHPELVRRYGRHLWLDPGDPRVIDYSLSVVLDVVRRYDIDGVHIDDYFYPYKEKDSRGRVIPFPDDATWRRYRQGGGKLARDDWRRENVNQFVRRLYSEVKAAKPWVKVGVSPFGIWRPGYPAQIQGFDAYAELYADARLWLRSGWLDYCSPQLYWPVAQRAQSYPVLLGWWLSQNVAGRHVWPGNYASRVGDGSRTAWQASEILDQIACTRDAPGATGNIQFSMKALMPSSGPLGARLVAGPYADVALVPPCPWLSSERPGAPRVTVLAPGGTGALRLAIAGSGPDVPRLWVVQSLVGDRWSTRVVSAGEAQVRLAGGAGADPGSSVAVSAVDRFGNQSEPTIVSLAASGRFAGPDEGGAVSEDR
ncbi:MAG: family 10 glycosylhydrolase [Chthonomonadales bacterium]|nr:family 10 glycosylhydrolase [Chthonomonadales bacterium]